MMDFLANLKVNQRLTTLLAYALAAAMMACLMVSVMQVVRAFSPASGGYYMVVLGFLFALEAFVVYGIRRNYSFLEPRWFLFYISEWVVLLLVVKIFQLGAHGAGYFLYEIQGWRVNFIHNFFNTEFMLTLVMLIIVWMVSMMIAEPLDVLRVDEKRLKAEEEVNTSPERAAARRQIIDVVLFVGVLMVLMTSLLRNDLTARWFNLPAMRSGVVNVVVYFALGLVLLSLTQFTVLQMRWSVNRITISPQLASRWFQYSLVFLLLLAAIVVILPTGYARTLLLALNWLLQVFLTLVLFIYWLLSLPLMLIGALLGMLAGEPVQLEFEPVEMAPSPKSNPDNTPLGFLEILRTILITALIGGLVLYSFYYFFKARGGRVSGLLRLRLLGWLSLAWNWIAAWLGGMGRLVYQSVREGVQKLSQRAPREAEASGWQYLNPRRLTARQRVQFYYLALVRRGTEKGIPRRPSQTPYEYAGSLSAAVEPELSSQTAPEEDIQAITEEFVQAQYTRHEITVHQANEVHRIWERLRRLFRKRRSSKQVDRRTSELR